MLLSIEHDQFLDRLESGDPIVRTLVDSLLRRTRSIVASLRTDIALPAEDIACDDPEERLGIDKIRLEAQLRDAIDTGTLEVRYQPIYDIPAGRVASYEALVRWELPERGPVSPAEFIKLAVVLFEPPPPHAAGTALAPVLVLAAVSGSRFQSPYCRMMLKPL